jgi:D-alanyl-D-alanine carboxypeptidase/D-alanyl-D-alanine-endopeptidase (penicillin-binding protein 4)
MWGVVVRDAGGAVLYRRNEDRLFHPASTMKVLTVAAAVERLGWEFRFETVVRATTPIDANGTIRGDLVVVGSGDPTISRRHDGAATLAGWADQLWQGGVRSIQGRVIGDGSAFGGTTLGEGWQWDDLASSYAAPINALTFNDNTAELLVAPGATAGALASVSLVDRAAGVVVVNQVRTVASDRARRISLERPANSSTVVLRGEVPLGYAPFKLFVAVADPPAYFARALRAALVARGITVAGPARSADTDPPGPFPPDAPVLVRHQSPPLSQIAATIMKASQNLHTELLLRAVPATEGTPTARLASSLASWGVDGDRVVAADGSGLSRYDLVTASALDAVLSRMYDRDDRATWLATFPVAGVDGTLERRMKGTPAEGRVFAKTGSIAYVRALAGYAKRLDDRWVQFAILANNFAGSMTPADVDRITDALVNRLITTATPAPQR